MSHRMYLAVELTIADGRGVDPDTLAEILEAEMPGSVEDNAGSMYDVEILGIGSTIENLRESVRLRLGAQRAFQNGGSAKSG